ncbi:MAG: hypothetical protein KBD51_02740 [Candidatus Levybacteria bacterium]|nr:hypothetical protein [Candidatus Levybacteria bacterium]
MPDGLFNPDSPRNSDWAPRGMKVAPQAEPQSSKATSTESSGKIIRDWKFNAAQTIAGISGLVMADGLFYERADRLILGAVAAGFSMAAGVLSQMGQNK